MNKTYHLFASDHAVIPLDVEIDYIKRYIKTLLLSQRVSDSSFLSVKEIISLITPTSDRVKQSQLKVKDIYFRDQDGVFHKNDTPFAIKDGFQLWTERAMILSVEFVTNLADYQSIPGIEKAKFLIKVEFDDNDQYTEGNLKFINQLIEILGAWVLVKESLPRPQQKSPQITEIESILQNSLGGSQVYTGQFCENFFYTENVKYLCDAAQSYWLITLIESYQPQLRNEEFQLWILSVEDGYSNPSDKINQVPFKYLKPFDGNGVATCWRDTPNPNSKPLVRQSFYTDFPLKQLKLYVNKGVLMLSVEY